MKQVIWATKKGRALMGELIEDNGNSLIIVKVTSVEDKRDTKLIGQKMAVAKAIVTIGD